MSANARVGRFPHRAAIRNVLRYGVKVATPLGRASLIRSRGRPSVLFVVSTGVSKRSTVRNRIRRRLTEWVRTHPSAELPGDVVVSLAPITARLSRRELIEAATRAFLVIRAASARQRT